MSVWKFLIDYINYIIQNTYVFGGSGMYFVLAYTHIENMIYGIIPNMLCCCFLSMHTVVWFQFLLTFSENEIIRSELNWRYIYT